MLKWSFDGACYQAAKTQIWCKTLAFCAACFRRVHSNLCEQKNVAIFTSATTRAIANARYFAQKLQNGVWRGMGPPRLKLFRDKTLAFYTACCPRIQRNSCKQNDETALTTLPSGAVSSRCFSQKLQKQVLSGFERARMRGAQVIYLINPKR